MKGYLDWITTAEDIEPANEDEQEAEVVMHDVMGDGEEGEEPTGMASTLSAKCGWLSGRMKRLKKQNRRLRRVIRRLVKSQVRDFYSKIFRFSSIWSPIYAF